MKKIKKFTKTLIINKFVTNVIKSLTLLILLLVFSFGNLFAKGVLAEETTPTETTVNNNAIVENSVDQTADTGNNAIASSTPTPSPVPESITEQTSTPQASPEPSPSPATSDVAPAGETEPSPTPSPEPSPSPEPTPNTNLDNNADVENNVESTSDSGNNSISEPEPPAQSIQEATPSANLDNQEATDSAQTIDSGDAISVVEVENSVNSTEVNSNVLNQTLNIFLSGDVDLTVVPLVIAQAVFAENNQDLQVINVAVYNGLNFAYLSNDIVSLANTGANSISGGDQATINTGNAYSVVSLVNKVNTTIIDSTIHIVTINIFGSLNGNIILPEFTEGGQCCGQITQIENAASLENNVSSSAVSGQNEIITAGQGSITTGDSQSAVNVINFVNTSIVDMLFQYLFVNTFGGWQGDFLGWNDILAAKGGGNLTLTSSQGGGLESGCPSCTASADIYNQAYVYNNISSTASTGGNSISGSGASIKTGKAYSAISLLNFINTNIFRSIGFFGFINIFGELDGDIGGESEFQKPEEETQEPPQEDNVPPVIQVERDEENEGPLVREEGGTLKVTQFSNNVGEYVLPGDTITFSVTVKNPGTGKVYGAQARISFILDGVDLGGAIFNLGDIEAGKGIKLTTGLVLSKDIKPGSYIARVKVWGEVGENGLVSDFKDSAFLVGRINLPPLLSADSGILGVALASESPQGREVLGSQKGGLSLEQKLWILLGVCIGAYLMLRGIRQRRKLALAFLKSKKFIVKKSFALRSFLFSYFPPFL